MSLTKAQKAADKELFKQHLLEILQPGDTVFCSLKKRSASGMTRCIDLRVFRGDSRNPTTQWLSYWVAKALDYTFDEKTEAVKIGGCGMDMGFHLVSTLAAKLFGDARALKHCWI